MIKKKIFDIDFLSQGSIPCRTAKTKPRMKEIKRLSSEIDILLWKAEVKCSYDNNRMELRMHVVAHDTDGHDTLKTTPTYFLVDADYTPIAIEHLKIILKSIKAKYT